MVEYYVVLGDVVHSRDIADREAFQERLQAVCDRFTAERRDDVFGNFKILKGVDEFGGVLQSLENLYEVVTAFQDELRPHEVRIVVSSGSIDVGLTSFDVEQMDGEAFHDADERLAEIEDGPLSFDLLIDDENLGRAIADQVNLLLHLRGEWTDRQREVVAVREDADTQTAAAERLGVSQQAVSSVLGGANWPLVSEVEGRLRETLAAFAEEPEAPPFEPGPRPIRPVLPLEGGRADAPSVGGPGRDESGDEPAQRDGPRPASTDFEEVEALVDHERYEVALVKLAELLQYAINSGAGPRTIREIRSQLDAVVAPIVTNTTDVDYAAHVLDLMIELAERVTGADRLDVERWSRAQYVHVVGSLPAVSAPHTDDPGPLVTDSYAFGIGHLLAGEPESAVKYLRRGWDQRDDDALTDHERGFAWSAGIALLGCADVLGPLVLPGPVGALRAEFDENRDLLREPARHVLEGMERGEDADPHAVREAVHDDEHDQFARLEARAFATLIELAAERDAPAG